MTDFELRGVADVLKQKRLAVPVHQRPFSWQAIEVQEFLDDIGAAFERKEEYFLGTIVLITESGAQFPQVIDGQQRLATGALVLAGVADMFSAAGDPERANNLRMQYLVSMDIESGVLTPHLTLSAGDEPFFRRLTGEDRGSLPAVTLDSHKRLLEADSTIRGWLSARAGSEPIPWLGRLTTFLTDLVKVILVEVPDDANGYLIFETLNDRGLDLSIADLLKNYLLGRAGHDTQSVLNHWTAALTALAAYGGENLFSTYLRHYWSSMYQLAREKELYRAIKGRITSQTSVLDFAQDLAQNSSYYAAILSPEHEYWAAASPEAQDAVRTLGSLGLQQYRPLLLAAMAHFTLSEVQKLVRHLVNWNVRLLVVGGGGGGVMERRYAELGQALRHGELKSASEVAERAVAFVPGDTVFHSSFTEASVSTVTLARYYLHQLEVQLRRERRHPDQELVPSGKLTLEHIFPEKPLSNWPQFTDEDGKASVNRLGNMTLLAHKANSELKSAPFEEKRRSYASSSLLITSELKAFSAWDTGSIEQRQKALANLAVKAWPMGVGKRKLAKLNSA